MNHITLLVLLTLARWTVSIAHFTPALIAWLQYAAFRLRLMFLVLTLRQYLGGQPRRYWRVVQAETASTPHRSRAKPAWVKHEVLRLAALTGDGCRSIEKLFNRLHAVRDNMTVGKSFVHYTIRDHRYEIEVLRRDIKRKPPRLVSRNHTWAIDMTGKGDLAGEVHSILGIVDHGSRKLLTLEVLEGRNSWSFLGHLFIAIGRYGAPRAIRSDNDAVFKSQVFRLGCKLAGIRQQFSVPGCPWMNGRIERLFGTLKQKLDRIEIGTREALVYLLGDFSIWYNAVRPHQNMAGLTPDEAWQGANPYANAPKSVHWFEAWDGLLKGYYLRC